MLCNCIALLCGQRARPSHLIVSVFPEVYLGHGGLQGGAGLWEGLAPRVFPHFQQVYLSPKVVDMGQAETSFRETLNAE